MMQRQPMGLEMVTRGINRNQISIPPRGTAAELKQVSLLAVANKIYAKGFLSHKIGSFVL